MAGTATITIRRQILDVEVHGTEAEGLALQRRLPGVCADVLCAGARVGASRRSTRATLTWSSSVWRSTCRASPSTVSMPSWPTPCNGRSRTTSAAIRGAVRRSRSPEERRRAAANGGRDRGRGARGVPPHRTAAVVVPGAAGLAARTARGRRVGCGQRRPGPATGHAGASVGDPRRPERASAPGDAVHARIRGDRAPWRLAAAGGDDDGGPGRARRGPVTVARQGGLHETGVGRRARRRGGGPPARTGRARSDGVAAVTDRRGVQ